VPLGKLRASDIADWIEDRRAAVGPYTLWRLHAVLRAGLNRAVKRQTPILLRNPASLVDPIEVDQEEIDPLSAAEARQVLAATEGTTDHALYAFDLSTGLRQGELVALRWAERVNDPGIDLERGEVRVYQQVQRGRFTPLKRSWHGRVLQLSPWLVEVLEHHADLLRDLRQNEGMTWQENGLVFPSERGTPRLPGNVWLS
jgi:integrase